MGDTAEPDTLEMLQKNTKTAQRSGPTAAMRKATVVWNTKESYTLPTCAWGVYFGGGGITRLVTSVCAQIPRRSRTPRRPAREVWGARAARERAPAGGSCCREKAAPSLGVAPHSDVNGEASFRDDVGRWIKANACDDEVEWILVCDKGKRATASEERSIACPVWKMQPHPRPRMSWRSSNAWLSTASSA